MSRSYDPRMHAYDDQTRHAGVIYILMLVIAVAFGGFVWQLYSAPEIPRIAAESGPYKMAPPPEAANAPDLKVVLRRQSGCAQFGGARLLTSRLAGTSPDSGCKAPLLPVHGVRISGGNSNPAVCPSM